MELSYAKLMQHPGVELVAGAFITGIGRNRITLATYRNGVVNITDEGKAFFEAQNNIEDAVIVEQPVVVADAPRKRRARTATAAQPEEPSVDADAADEADAEADAIPAIVFSGDD